MAKRTIYRFTEAAGFDEEFEVDATDMTYAEVEALADELGFDNLDQMTDILLSHDGIVERWS